MEQNWLSENKAENFWADTSWAEKKTDFVKKSFKSPNTQWATLATIMNIANWQLEKRNERKKNWLVFWKHLNLRFNEKKLMALNLFEFL